MQSVFTLLILPGPFSKHDLDPFGYARSSRKGYIILKQEGTLPQLSSKRV
jgi:hypothetical protein